MGRRGCFPSGGMVNLFSRFAKVDFFCRYGALLCQLATDHDKAASLKVRHRLFAEFSFGENSQNNAITLDVEYNDVIPPVRVDG